MNLHQNIVLIIAFAAWCVSGQARAAGSYLPKNALACERGGRKCKHCNVRATIGALERITIQTGGCGVNNLTTVMEFTPDGADFLKPINVPELKTGRSLVIGGNAFPAVRRGLNMGNDSAEIQTVVADCELIPDTNNCGNPAHLNIGLSGGIVTIFGSVTIGDATTTATIPGTAKTNIISPATATSVSVPGSGQNSLQIGTSGECRGLYYALLV